MSKVIVAGSREITDYQVVCDAIQESGFEITELVSGCAKGVDTLGEHWAMEHDVPIKKFTAQWNTWGKIAGVLRNRAMAEYADAAIVIWDGESRGSANMLLNAKQFELKIFEKVVQV